MKLDAIRSGFRERKVEEDVEEQAQPEKRPEVDLSGFGSAGAWTSDPVPRMPPRVSRKEIEKQAINDWKEGRLSFDQQFMGEPFRVEAEVVVHRTRRGAAIAVFHNDSKSTEHSITLREIEQPDPVSHLEFVDGRAVYRTPETPLDRLTKFAREAGVPLDKVQRAYGELLKIHEEERATARIARRPF